MNNSINDPYIESWNTFQESLVNSICAIDSSYINIHREQANDVLRERTYCYELYHQIQSRLNIEPFLIHAEVDKKGHYIIKKQLNYEPNPDFIVHIPGTMENLVVMEVKGSSVNSSEAQNDINKLTDFVEKLNYRHGIFLVFGTTDPKLNLEFRNEHISYILHEEPGKAPRVITKGDWSFATG